MSEDYGKIDYFEEWKAQYNDFIDSAVNSESLEELIFNTFKYVEFLESQPDTKRDTYLFAVEMAKILGINEYSNIDTLKTRVYDCFINAILMNIFYGSHRGYIENAFTVYLNTERLNDPTEFKLDTLEDLQIAIKDLSKDILEMDGEDELE